MRSIVLIGLCLACAGHARRVQTQNIQQQVKHVVQTQNIQQQVKHVAEQMQEKDLDLKTLATLLLASSPRSAYTLNAMQARQAELGYGGGYRNIPANGGRYNSLYDSSPSQYRNSHWGSYNSRFQNGYDYSSPYRQGYGGQYRNSLYNNYDSPSQHRGGHWGSYDSPSQNGYDYSSPYRRGYGRHHGNSLYNNYDSPSHHRNSHWGSYDSPSQNGYDYSSPYRRGYGRHYGNSLYDSYDSPAQNGWGSVAQYRNRFGNGYSSRRGYGGQYRNNFGNSDSAHRENRWGAGFVDQSSGSFQDMGSSYRPTSRQTRQPYLPYFRDTSHRVDSSNWQHSPYSSDSEQQIRRGQILKREVGSEGRSPYYAPYGGGRWPSIE